ncbi:hypothetical protein QQS21_003151 [Conoideocrella luteorostrata]|uniref:isoleucine--tRNA ligase n=1 Tax=Conoideocrella luteorostrata TaxID=1105319 RepID=A0AAJ0CUS4_9HYPO|nr:hypothetical protein QQS21_003151 [Conoideocrella luteorostrata]
MDFSKVEEETLRMWRDIDAFKTQLRLTKDGPRFSFYDGPPFATGLPHYGHLLTGTLKDIIPRYWSMRGYHVTRRFGWDTHGVPIEYQIDKKFGMSGPDAVRQMGIDRYNAECKAIVMKYAGEWKQNMDRLGRWVDMDNDYKAMDPSFMETVWWVFKQLFDKDQVYRAYRIMPYSTALCTPLSLMESKEDVRMTQDPALLVSFPLVGVDGRPSTSLVVYTTTPWTLPSNLLIAVHPEFDYVEIRDEISGKRLITMEAGLNMLYKDPKRAKYNVLSTFKGAKMVGWKYEPLFHYYTTGFSDCFQVIAAEYVEAGQGTGLVHQAPAFGQEDYDAAVAAGFISPGRLPPCPVDEKGCFTDEIAEYAGLHVKAADKAIIRDLRPSGRLILECQIMHEDKFCWRSHTQLIRKAVSSWFVKVENSVPDMMRNLEGTNWTPEFVRDKRFASWILNARDWNVSRNRYWGTPLPLWVSDDYEEVICVGSVEELRKLSGYTGEIDDLHRDKIDHITIPSRKGKGVLTRVKEVFDCWFESGSMPYASLHYPFENHSDFHGGHFPADFIAEGLDQTRGWFYTLTVLGNKLFGKSPFRNVLVNGMILGEDGKKMSKSEKNFPDPSLIFDKYGSDSLRLYLISSPVVKAEPLRFKESGVREIISKVLLPLWNSYRFFSEQAILFKKSTGRDFVADQQLLLNDLENVMDRWILAECQSMLKFIETEMPVVPRLLKMIENLTNWYIRFNRKRLKGTAGLALTDTTLALNTLLEVLFVLVRALAPFIPFLTDHIYGLLKPFLSLGPFVNTQSVHFLSFPTPREDLLDGSIERRVASMQKAIQLGRVARERRNISLKTPLLSLVVIGSEQFLLDIDSMSSYIKEELNVRDVILTNDEEKYAISLQAKVDWPSLGKKLKQDVQIVRRMLPNLTQQQLREYQKYKEITIQNIKLEEGDLAIVRVLAVPSNGPSNTDSKWEPAFADEAIVLLDITPHPELVDEGLVRDLISRVQRVRKKAGLVPTDDVQMRYTIVSNPENIDVDSIVFNNGGMLEGALRGMLKPASHTNESAKQVLVEEEQSFGKLLLKLLLFKNKLEFGERG